MTLNRSFRLGGRILNKITNDYDDLKINQSTGCKGCGNTNDNDLNLNQFGTSSKKNGIETNKLLTEQTKPSKPISIPKPPARKSTAPPAKPVTYPVAPIDGTCVNNPYPDIFEQTKSSWPSNSVKKLSGSGSAEPLPFDTNLGVTGCILNTPAKNTKPIGKLPQQPSQIMS